MLEHPRIRALQNMLRLLAFLHFRRVVENEAINVPTPGRLTKLIGSRDEYDL